MGENLSAYLETTVKNWRDGFNFLKSFWNKQWSTGPSFNRLQNWTEASVGRRCKVSVLCYQHAAMTSAVVRERERGGDYNMNALPKETAGTLPEPEPHSAPFSHCPSFPKADTEHPP